MYRRLALLFLIYSLTFTNCYSQKSKQILQQGVVKRKDYLVEIPFQYVNKHIFIEVLIAKKKYNFLLDTGFETNVISQNIASETPHILNKEVEISGSSISKEKVQLMELPKITIANLDFENTYGIIQNLDYIQKTYDSLKIDGIIGNNLMRKSNWQIDFKKKIIRISDQIDSLEISKTASVIELSRKKWGNSYIDLFIDGKKHKFIFDLGSSGRFTAESDFVKYLNTKNLDLTKPFQKREIFIEKVKIGNIELKDQTISLEKGVSSLIGNAFFQDYLLTIDWNKNKLYLSTQ